MPLCRTLLLRLASLLVLVIAGTAPALAERIEPPLELLYMPGNALVAGPLAEINPSGRLVFKRDDVLFGKPRPPELIDVRVPKELLSKVKIGNRYVFGYSTLQADPGNPTRLVARTDGYVMLDSTGIEPALFDDTREVRALLKLARSEHGRESRRMFESLTKALDGSDPTLQNLAAGQFALEPELGERLREGKGRDVIEKVARDPRTPANVRVTLLTAAARRPGDFGEWAQPAALEVVTNTSVDGYSSSASGSVNLILTSLELLDRPPASVPSEVLRRWLWSAYPPIVERASAMLRRQSPALERTAIEQALADPALPAATQKFLRDRLHRLDRIERRTRGQKDGTG